MQQDESLTWRLTIVYSHYGDRLRTHGDYGQAARCYRQSLSLMQQMGNVDMIAYPLGNLEVFRTSQRRLPQVFPTPLLRLFFPDLFRCLS